MVGGLIKGYIVAVYEKIEDSELLKKYTEKAAIAIKKHSGKILVRGERSKVLRSLHHHEL